VDAEELFETANRLKAEGKEVTALSLLDALGGGSLRTIYKHLEAWQKQSPAEVKIEANEIPAQVQAAFASAWRLAAQEAGREVTAVKEKAAEEVSAALRNFHGALEAIGKLEKESEADAQELEEVKAKLAEVEAVAHAAQTEAAKHKAALEQLERLLAKQEADLERLRKEASEEQARHGKAEQQASGTIEQLKEALKVAQEGAKKLEAESKESRSQAEQSQKAAAKAEEASRGDKAARESAIKEAAEQKGRAEALKTQNAELLALVGDREKKKGQ
jgi:chromosome segregation ATPase